MEQIRSGKTRQPKQMGRDSGGVNLRFWFTVFIAKDQFYWSKVRDIGDLKFEVLLEVIHSFTMFYIAHSIIYIVDQYRFI